MAAHRRGILRFSAVSNLGFRPFKSGGYRAMMEELHGRCGEEMTLDDSEFQEAVLNQLRWEPGRAGGDPVQWLAWWRIFMGLPSCTGQSPPILKFARWWSVSSCWRYFRSEIFLLRIVLRRMAADHATTATFAPASLWDKDNVEKRSTHILERVPTYCDDELFVTMDIYMICTRALEAILFQLYRNECDSFPSIISNSRI